MPKMESMTQNHPLRAVGTLRKNHGFIPAEAFYMRKAYFSGPDKGLLHDKVQRM